MPSPRWAVGSCRATVGPGSASISRVPSSPCTTSPSSTSRPLATARGQPFRWTSTSPVPTSSPRRATMGSRPCVPRLARPSARRTSAISSHQPATAAHLTSTRRRQQRPPTHPGAMPACARACTPTKRPPPTHPARPPHGTRKVTGQRSCAACTQRTTRCYASPSALASLTARTSCATLWRTVAPPWTSSRGARRRRAPHTTSSSWTTRCHC
mmetsp:Transcript_30236/g.81250  ORF Transcript_30236/g.81250 Transcript_30236/m.81250 type:complete len:212 (+) Transcript_30236:998-1633(+)